jgi:hypothetical protein
MSASPAKLDLTKQSTVETPSELCHGAGRRGGPTWARVVQGPCRSMRARWSERYRAVGYVPLTSTSQLKDR